MMSICKVGRTVQVTLKIAVATLQGNDRGQTNVRLDNTQPVQSRSGSFSLDLGVGQGLDQKVLRVDTSVVRLPGETGQGLITYRIVDKVTDIDLMPPCVPEPMEVAGGYAFSYYEVVHFIAV
jgi:hypothetical protein